MLLTASVLASFQRCSRRWRLEQKYQTIRPKPVELFARILKQAIYELSCGRPKQEVSKRAQVRFLEVCAKPGISTQYDPYVLGYDFNSMLQTIVESISRTVLLALRPGPAVEIAPGIVWQCESWADESGLLHRWTIVDRWDNDKLSKELHSWPVFGDIAAAHAPMMVHVIEIGHVSKGHQNSPWCKCFKHPMMLGVFRFQCRDGSKLKGNWLPLYFQDSNNNTPEKWVDLMFNDNVELIHHINVREPSNEHIEDSVRQIQVLVERMKAAKEEWYLEPMTRNACDFTPCPWQPVCYNRTGRVNPETIGGFKLLASK